MSAGIWDREKAQRWALDNPWWVGCNFIPSTASNQFEMWQVDTFDPATIARELNWASQIGMNCVRVFLHDLVWQADPEGFKSRIDRFLQIAESADSAICRKRSILDLNPSGSACHTRS